MPDTADRVAFPRLQLGISSCLLGEQVRYDGGHKRHAFLTDVLADYADYVSVCPEAAIGMGVPRPPIQLVGDAAQPRALGVDDPHMDVTARLQRFARTQAARLRTIDGYIFKKDSPSCGVARVKLFTAPNGRMQRKATGLYAAGLMAAQPLLPVEEEDAFDDPRRRDHFLTRVYVYRRWRQLLDDGLSAGRLIDFHSAHKYLIMAHSQAAYRRLGHLLADFSQTPPDAVAGRYISELSGALKRRSQRRQHGNVLTHIAGYLKNRMNGKEKAALQRSLDSYMSGQGELFDMLCGLRILFARYPDAYIARQVYLQPYPDQLRQNL